MSARLVLVVSTLAMVVGACSVSTDAASPTATAEQSEIAPIFAVETMDGSFSLSDHLANDGRPVFLNLWASWCFPCREEMPAIDRSSVQHPDIAFVGVSVQDSREDAMAFAEEIGVGYTLGFDEGNAVDDAYRPLGLPASYIISSEGIILERIFGKITEEDLTEKFEKHFG